MTNKEISNFQDVVMFELQRRLADATADKRLFFPQIWKLCAAAAINIPGCPPESLRRQFIAKMLWSLETLDTLKYISVHTKGSDKDLKITHVTLRLAGVAYLKETLFTHQERFKSLPLETPHAGS